MIFTADNGAAVDPDRIELARYCGPLLIVHTYSGCRHTIPATDPAAGQIMDYLRRRPALPPAPLQPRRRSA